MPRKSSLAAAVMFSGAAGSSLGAQRAGLRVVWAANHSPLCIATHRANCWPRYPRGKYRSPTIREAFNLMGFPRNYILPEAGRSVASALAGDAVCPPVMEGLLRIVLDAS